MTNKITIDLNIFEEGIKIKSWSLVQKSNAIDSPFVKRLIVESNNWNIELLPSKGFSIGQAIYKNQKIFWDAPIGLIDPNEFNPFDEDIYINSKTAKGFSFLKTFASGLEFYGLENWGMPLENPNKLLLPLHGGSSNIPVDKFEFQVDEDSISFWVSFEYKSMQEANSIPWYQNGESIYRIVRHIEINEYTGEIVHIDKITNISTRKLSPDWGYHITLQPKAFSKLLIPSIFTECRGDETIPNDIETWYPAQNETIRTETGIIHKNLKIWETEKGPLNRVLQKKGESTGVLVSFSPSPYTQSWFCNGGAFSKEFTYRDETPVFEKSWNGQGIEIGASALDHDSNTDSSVLYEPALSPGEYKQIVICIKTVNGAEFTEIENEIVQFNKSRKK